MKCDEQLPVCQNCVNSNRKCIRGVRLNFTQYTFYDPNEGSAQPLQPRHWAFMDQLLAVCRCYENGDAPYGPYLHLHRPADLAELAARLDMELHALHALPPEEPPFFLPDVAENIEITSVLMNPPPEPPRRRSVPPVAPAPWLPSESVVALIQTHNYHWLLDLFNEVAVWKALVPSYTVRAAQSVSEADPLTVLLLRCLLCCADTAPLAEIVSVCKSLAHEWGRSAPQPPSPQFDRLLLGVSLSVLALLHCITRDAAVASLPDLHAAIANQGLLFHKIVAAYAATLPLRHPLLVVAAVQAFTVLRFFLKMHLQRLLPLFSYAVVPPAQGVHDLVISYDAPPDWSHFFSLTDLEIALINYADVSFDIPQLDPTSNQPDLAATSDAKKLREKLNNLVKVDYIHDNPHTTGLFVLDPVDASFFGPSLSRTSGRFHSISPNEKSIAMNILAAYSDVIHISGLSRDELHKIFLSIQESRMSDAIKRQWARHFSWTLS